MLFVFLAIVQLQVHACCSFQMHYTIQYKIIKMNPVHERESKVSTGKAYTQQRKAKRQKVFPEISDNRPQKFNETIQVSISPQSRYKSLSPKSKSKAIMKNNQKTTHGQLAESQKDQGKNGNQVLKQSSRIHLFVSQGKSSEHNIENQSFILKKISTSRPRQQPEKLKHRRNTTLGQNYSQRIVDNQEASYIQRRRRSIVKSENFHRQENKNQIGKSNLDMFFESDRRTQTLNETGYNQIVESKLTKSNNNQTKLVSTEQSRNQIRNMQTGLIRQRNLNSFRVQFKKIQEVYEDKRLQQEAKNFVLKLKRQKREFDGKIYLLKRQQQHKRKLKQFAQKQDKFIEEKIKKMEKLKKIQKRIEDFKQKSIERQQVKYRRENSISQSITKIKQKLNKYTLQQQIKHQPSKSYILGKKYLEESGRKKSRARTQSCNYPADLSQDQIAELNKIRSKIQQLTKSFKV